jgi:hypothetical protein
MTEGAAAQLLDRMPLDVHSWNIKSNVVAQLWPDEYN